MGSLAADFEAEVPPEGVGRVEVGPDGGDFEDVKSDKPITDWSDVLRRFNLDVNEFEVDGDTIRMSTWQQSKRLDNGERDIINLYSYRGSFRRIRNNGHVEALSALIRPSKPRTIVDAVGLPMVVCLADAQMGKDGPDVSTPEQMNERFDAALAKVAGLVKARQPSELVIADNGDPVEGITSSAANQIATNTLSLDEQLRWWQRRLTQTILTLAPLAGKTFIVAVPSNHGEIRNPAGKVGYGDYGLGVARTVRDAFDMLGTELDLEFVFPATDHDVVAYIDIGGGRVAFTHGHHAKVKDRMPQWVANQAASTRSPMRDATIVVHGHFHTPGYTESRGRAIVSCSMFDSGSSWFENLTGEFSRPAITTFNVKDGWVSDLHFVEP